MNTVKSLSVESIQMSHDAREISLRGTQTDVIVLCEAPHYVKLSFVFLFGLPPFRCFPAILLHIIPMV